MTTEWVSIASFPGLPSHLVADDGLTLCGIDANGRKCYPLRPDNPHCSVCAVASSGGRWEPRELISGALRVFVDVQPRFVMSPVDKLRALYAIFPSEEIRQLIERAEDSEDQP